VTLIGRFWVTAEADEMDPNGNDLSKTYHLEARRVHTNGLENFWSLLKRGIAGTREPTLA